MQPYLTAVEARGEVSVICIAGEPTHAVHKLPAAGEFRIHDHWGGSAEPTPLTPADVAVARAALGTLRSTPAYARIDMIDDGERPRVIEPELIEPYLWFELAPHAAERLADVLLLRARHH